MPTEGLADSDSESWDDRNSAEMAEVLEVQELAGVLSVWGETIILAWVSD